MPGPSWLSAAALRDREPRAVVPDRQLSRRRIAIGPGQPRDRHALCAGIAHVLAVVDVEVLPIGAQGRGHVADTAEHEPVGRLTHVSVRRRVQDDAEVVPRATAIARARGADIRQLTIVAAARAGRAFVVVEAVPRAGGVRDDGLHPDAVAGMGIEDGQLASLQPIEAGTGRVNRHAAPRREDEQPRSAVLEVPHERIAGVDLAGQQQS